MANKKNYKTGKKTVNSKNYKTTKNSKSNKKKVNNNFINNIKDKFINIWKNDPRDLIIPGISILLGILATITIGIVRAIIIVIIINAIYFTIIYFMKKDKKDNLNEKQTKTKTKNRLKIVLIVLLTCFILGIIAMIGFFSYIVIQAPDFDESLLYVADPSVILDKDGNEIAKLGTEKRVTITYDEMPEVLVDAIVATEDSRFFEHNGVDWARFLKASFYQLLGKSDAGGASTITMQVSKNTYTSTEDQGIKGIIRKFTDVYVSEFKIEKNYTKPQILEFYVNSYYLGNGAYGVEQAALNYFGKSAKDLNVAEASMIAGLFQAPAAYDPYRHPEAAEKRRQTVLKLMLRHGYITKEEYEIAKDLSVDKIIINADSTDGNNSQISEYQSFVDAVVSEVQEKTGYDPYTTSMTIYSTMNTDFQKYLNDIMNGVTFNWENELVQAGVAVVNVKDGGVAALGGGRNVNAAATFNYATDINNQIGSTAKPLYDYGPAIEFNDWSTGQIVPDEPITYSDGHPIYNWDGKFNGYQTARIALAYSRNIPALKTFKQVDKAKIIEFVTGLGLTPEIYTCDEGYTRDKKKCINNEDPTKIVDAKQDTTLHEAHAIGGYNGESPLTLAAAYSAFANQGVYNEPHTFTKLVYQATNEEYVNKYESHQAMSQETAYMVADMLITTAKEYIGYNINNVNYAGKTGTTNYDEKTMIAHHMPSNAVNDLWIVGFNTEYTIAVWYGYDSINHKYYNRLSGKDHTRIFQAMGMKAFTNHDNFIKPEGVISVTIEAGNITPMLPSEFTPSDQLQTDLYKKGTAPDTVSGRFTRLSDVSNLKASDNEGTVTLSWGGVAMPEANTEAFIRKEAAKVYENQGYLNSYVGSRLAWNASRLGSLGYNIYRKNSDGSLTLLDFVTSTSYTVKESTSGAYTYVVKTAYSIFKSNMSGGKSVSLNVTVKDPIIPDPGDEDEDTEN